MANDHLILDDITTQHDTMQDAVIAKSSDRVFENGIQEAANYMAWCIDKGLKNLGITLHGKMQPGIIEDILKAKKVEVQQYKSREHSGVYIYQDTELQYFISDIIIPPKDKFIIFHKQKFIVRTNVV